MAKEHLAYISKASPNLVEDDIRLILEQSRRNNPHLRITGHLQCRAGYFFQVLEGPSEGLDCLIDRLRQDPRHSDLQILYREPLVGRNFANWSMGFGPCVSGSDADAVGRRLQDLCADGTASARTVLGMFFSLMNSSPESGARRAQAD